VLPDEILQSIHPLSEVDAQSACSIGLALLDNEHSLSGMLFDDIRTMSADMTHEQGVHVFRSWHDNLDQPITLSWESHLAVNTRWGVFSYFWDDFYYPGPDDLIIFPEDRSWAVHLSYDEALELGRTTQSIHI